MAERKRSGLGTGLDALLGAQVPKLDNVTALPVSKIEPRADQPRDRFDEAALEELAESIRQHGMIQPITVRELGGGYYQIIAGERRWRAARIAELREVPVRVIAADDAKAMELALVENLQREDLNPIEEAQGYRTLIDVYGFTQEQASQSVGRSRPAVANALRLLALSPEVLALVEEGALSAGHARALLAIRDPELQLSAARRIIEGNFSVRQAESLAAKLAKEPEPPKAEPGGLTVDYAAEVSRELEQSLGRRVRLVDGRKKGRIELEFYGSEDREALIGALRTLTALHRSAE